MFVPPPNDPGGVITRLISQAATGARELTAPELQRALDHVASAGFDPAPVARAGRLGGVVWQGRVLRGRDQLPSAEVHYLRHVVVNQEWPPGTTLVDYLASITEVIGDPRSGVVTSRFRGEWQLGVVRHSERWRGPQGFTWLLVEYRVRIGHWMTAFQPQNDLNILHDRAREDLRWLRRPA